MIFYFKTRPNKCGNVKQLVINTEKKQVSRGFFLFSSSVDAVTVSPRQLDEIAKQAEKQTARPVYINGRKATRADLASLEKDLNAGRVTAEKHTTKTGATAYTVQG